MTSKEALERIKEIPLDEYKGYKTVDYLYKNEIEILEKLVDQENENLMLKTKLAMYEELDGLRKDFIERLAHRYNFHYLDINIQELEKQIKALDKKCDGECSI